MSFAGDLWSRFRWGRTTEPARVVIIGAGFGGLGMAIQLKRAGHHNFLVVEKANDIGGVWRDNTYPGAACDVPSHLYCYSFEQDFGWSQRYATQPEIHAYLEQCTEKYGLDEHLKLGTEIASADFDERTGQWRLLTATGELIDADVLVPACGQLGRPATPDIPGLNSFTGTIMHSSRWQPDRDLSGRRVAVIGTGSSALQIVPAIAARTDRLTVFQRSASHIVPRLEASYSTARRQTARAPRTLSRLGWWLLYESMALGITRWPPAAAGAVRGSRALLAAQVEDPELRARLTPDTEIGCKRVGISSTYYPALVRPNVEVATDRIVAVTEHGIRTADAAEHVVDTIILATGFEATDFLAPMRIRGRDGQELSRVWRHGARAYLGITVPSFPNMFLIYGPNTNIGAGSIIYMLESQIRYIRRAIAKLTTAPGHSFDVRPRVEDRFHREMQRRMRSTAWVTCRSWYRHANGQVTNNWPGQTFEYRWRTSRFVLGEYRVTAHNREQRPAGTNQ